MYYTVRNEITYPTIDLSFIVQFEAEANNQTSLCPNQILGVSECLKILTMQQKQR